MVLWLDITYRNGEQLSFPYMDHERSTAEADLRTSRLLGDNIMVDGRSENWKIASATFTQEKDPPLP